MPYLQVYRGILNKSIPVAIKTMEDQTLEAKQNFVEEIVALMNLRHANVSCMPQHFSYSVLLS